MTPQQAHAAAVTELADLLARAHDDPHDAANRYLSGLVRAGWRPVGALADRPGPAHRAPADVAHAALAEARAEVARKKRAREEREAGTDSACARGDHDWTHRGTPGDEWRECFLCGIQR